MDIQVVGAGGWGLALARVLSLNGHRVRIWCREEDDPDRLKSTRESSVYLPGVKLPDAIEVVRNVDRDCDVAVLAVPSHAMRSVVAQYPLSGDVIRVSVAKGIENESLMRMDEVIHDVSGPCTVVALSGPSHAEEVARDCLTSVCVAGEDATACEHVQAAFNNDTFRVYTSPDIIGVELGGSLKNIIAIAAGVVDGLSLGDNARAALITRGLAEMSRLGTACGADAATFAGLSGLGDLIVTCSSRHSRNRALGERIASGMTLSQALDASPMVAEGVPTTKSAYALSHREDVEMPITEQVYRVLFEDADPREAITQLMIRDPKPERS